VVHRLPTGAWLRRLVGEVIRLLTLGTWQVDSFSESFITVQSSVVWGIHINGEAAQHLVNSLFKWRLENVVFESVQIVEKRIYPFLIVSISIQSKNKNKANNDGKVILTRFGSSSASLLQNEFFFYSRGSPSTFPGSVTMRMMLSVKTWDVVEMERCDSLVFELSPPTFWYV